MSYREILFRGKRIDNDEWAYGFYVHRPDISGSHFIVAVNSLGTLLWFEVGSETVGQFTGLTDMNGRKIFEGDIVKSYDVFGYVDGCGVVQWDEMFLSWHVGQDASMYGKIASYEVIGAVHDNPRLSED